MPPSNPATSTRLLLCALTLFAGCAKSVGSDLPAIQDITDADAGAANEVGGSSAAGSSGSNASAGAVGSVGGANAAGSTSVAGSTSTAGANAAGAATTGGAGNGGGGSANGGSSSAGMSNSGGKSSTAGSGSSGGGATGSAGSGATSHVCNTSIDLNTYTASKDGCGGYAVCKGQIHFKNNESQALTQVSIGFSVTTGVTCTADHSGSKWTITDNGASSKHCVFTASGTPWSVDAGATFGFGYDTTQSNSTAPKDVTISDPSCGG